MKTREDFEHPIIYSSSKQSKNLEKSKDEVESLFLTPVLFRPIGATAIKTGLILFWTSLQGLRDTPTNHL